MMYGEPVGKSGWNLPPAVPDRPQTPWSPDATSSERPRRPAFWNCVLHVYMKAAEVCCFSSLP